MKKLLITLFATLLYPVCAFAEPDIESIENLQKEIQQAEVQQTEIKQNIFNKKEIVNYKTFKISAVDNKNIKNKNDKLIIYTSLYGKSTKSDTTGFEAVIVNNRVVKLNQYNSFIPENGYVVSGHGKAKKFILDNFFVGADIDIDFEKGLFKILTKPDNYLYEAAYRLDNTKQFIQEADQSKIDIDGMNFYLSRSEKLLTLTKKLVQFEDYERAPEMAQKSMAYSDMALFYSVLFDPKEFRGVWVFPYQKNDAEVAQNFEHVIGRMDMENVVLEVFYNGLTIYPSEVAKEYKLPAQNRYYKDFDPLDSWIKNAKGEDKKNIYVSFNTFNVGNPAKSTIKENIVSICPDWQNKTKFKTTKQGELYLDPANPEVQKYILNLMNEITKKYEIAGINLGGVRYPDGDYGYTDYARKEFKNLYGIDPIKLSQKDKLWTQWQNYKDDKIAEFVNKVAQFQKNNPNIQVLINVYPDSANIKKWNIDDDIALCPVLTSTDDDFASDFVEQIKNAEKTSKIYSIYKEPYFEEKPRKLFDQINASRKQGANGIILYTIDYLTKEYIDALRLSVFDKPSEKKQKHLYESENKKKAAK